MAHFNITPKFKYSTLLYFQIREIFSVYRPNLSFHKNHQAFQGWNTTPNMKIEILKNEI